MKDSDIDYSDIPPLGADFLYKGHESHGPRPNSNSPYALTPTC